jgi:hypothetical protein
MDGEWCFCFGFGLEGAYGVGWLYFDSFLFIYWGFCLKKEWQAWWCDAGRWGLY